MEQQLAVLAATVIAIELFLKLPFLATIHEFTRIVRKAVAVIRSKSISDHRKEIVLPGYSIAMMRCSLSLLAYLLVVISAIWAIELACRTMGISVLAVLATVPGMFASILISAIYIYLRRRIYI